jgi:hypothetical protein
MRVAIRVRPRAGRTTVGGTRDGALLVHVSEPAVDGAATCAALLALAHALGLRPREVTLISGATSRTKIVEIPDAARTTFDALSAR